MLLLIVGLFNEFKGRLTLVVLRNQHLVNFNYLLVHRVFADVMMSVRVQPPPQERHDTFHTHDAVVKWRTFLNR